MATSGSTNHSITRDNIIYDALWLIGALGESETPSTATLTFTSRVLNNMIKAWQAEGLNLWTRTEATIFLTVDDGSYNLNSSSGAHAANNSNVVETTLSAAHGATTTLTVTSSTGMTAADKILIELDDDTLHSTTIVSVDSSTQVTITSALASAAASANNVYTYTTKMDRPLDILSIRYRDDNSIDRALQRLSHEEYFNLADKTVSSVPTSYYYDPQLSTGVVYIWPVPSTVDGRLKITYTRTLEDFDASTNNPDFPIEWAEALVYNLAMRIASAYGKEQKIIQVIGPMAQTFKQELLNWDNEKSSLFLVPDDRD